MDRDVKGTGNIFDDIFDGEERKAGEGLKKSYTTPEQHREKIQSYYIKKTTIFIVIAIAFAIGTIIYKSMGGWGEYKRTVDANATKPALSKEIEANKSVFDAGINTNTWQSQYQDKLFTAEGKMYKFAQNFDAELNKTNKKIDSLSDSVQKGFNELKNGGYQKQQIRQQPSSQTSLPIKELPPRLKPTQQVQPKTNYQGASDGFFGVEHQNDIPKNTEQRVASRPQQTQTQPAMQPRSDSYYSKYTTDVIKPSSGRVDTTTLRQSVGNDDSDTFHLLSASAEGILATGIVVPADDAGAATAVPVKIVINGEAIQANDERSDLDGCFVIGSATGNLSTERIDIRLNSLSCVVTKGKVKKRIEKKIEGWVFSSQGSNGIKGRLVTRTGQELARVLSAGVLQGVAGAFAPSNNLSIAGLGTVSTLPSSSFGDKAAAGLENGAYSGAQNALSMLANYYIKLANKRFPSLEANPGQKVTVEFKGETDLKLEPHRTLNIKGDSK